MDKQEFLRELTSLRNEYDNSVVNPGSFGIKQFGL